MYIRYDVFGGVSKSKYGFGGGGERERERVGGLIIL